MSGIGMAFNLSVSNRLCRGDRSPLDLEYADAEL